MKKVKALINFSKYTDAGLETKAGYILQLMTGNPSFTDPIPTLAELGLVLNSYSKALVEAAGLDRVKVAEKNKLRFKLEQMLSQLGTYVNYAASGDEAIITSSGFSVNKAPEPRIITNPGIPVITNGINSGQLVSSVKAVKGASVYLHEIAPDPLTDNSVWKSTPSSRSRFTFTDLQPGKKYWVRVAAIGSKDQIAYSNNASLFVQ
jgi:hypothetical protein